MNIQILASGSKGNCYVIQDGSRKIMIDPGIPIKKIRRACRFNLAELDFCLVSHEHIDHIYAIKDIMRIGIPVVMSAGTLKHVQPNGALYHIVKSEEAWISGQWCVLPFKIEHDAEEPLGFLIGAPSGERIMFLTDSCYCKYTFKNISYFMIECNYSEEMINDNDVLHQNLKNRIRTNHFELSNLKTFFRYQNLSNTKAIYLLHLSENNSDRETFIREIQEVTGVPVY